MKALKYILSTLLLIIAVWSCTQDDFGNTDFVGTAVAPSNVSALFKVTQDNTGLVSIFPSGEGAASFEIKYGDATTTPAKVAPGKVANHTYAEGNYTVTITAYGITGLKTEVTLPLAVSFQAPQFGTDPIVVNDLAVSKQVNVTVPLDATNTITFDVYFGEAGNIEPVSANVGGTVSYKYAETGMYNIRIVLKGAAIETTETTVSDFEVTAILQPIASAPHQPIRLEADYISIYSDTYTNVANCNYNPDWGQTTIYTAFDLNGDAMLQYSNLNYQGIQIGAPQDVSTLETLHIDVWSATENTIDFYPLPVGIASADEKFFTLNLLADQWNSFDIPLTYFIDQGLILDNIHQFKFVGSGSIFVDNIYFYKAPSGVSTSLMIEDFEGILPTLNPFGVDGAGVLIVSNPDVSGVNTTSMVTQFTKSAGAETWAGVFIDIASPIDLDNYNKVNVKVWSPNVGTSFILKIENPADPNSVYEQALTTTVANAWEDLLFDFSGAPVGTYTRVVVFPDYGSVGDGTTFYFDEVVLTN